MPTAIATSTAPYPFRAIDIFLSPIAPDGGLRFGVLSAEVVGGGRGREVQRHVEEEMAQRHIKKERVKGLWQHQNLQHKIIILLARLASPKELETMSEPWGWRPEVTRETLDRRKILPGHECGILFMNHEMVSHIR
jgi:hypothetical protein